MHVDVTKTNDDDDEPFFVQRYLRRLDAIECDHCSPPPWRHNVPISKKIKERCVEEIIYHNKFNYVCT